MSSLKGRNQRSERGKVRKNKREAKIKRRKRNVSIVLVVGQFTMRPPRFILVRTPFVGWMGSRSEPKNKTPGRRDTLRPRTGPIRGGYRKRLHGRGQVGHQQVEPTMLGGRSCPLPVIKWWQLEDGGAAQVTTHLPHVSPINTLHK